MKLSLRHVVWAPLLLAALALSYVVTESVQLGPCREQPSGWMANNVIKATFAVYFLFGYWIAVSRRYLVMVILTLWAWHLLLLSPYLTATDAEHHRLDQLRQVMGFGLREFVIASAVTAIASSYALFLRYRRVNDLPANAQRTFLRILVAAATAVSITLGAGAYWMIERRSDAFGSFGADLPAPTLILLGARPYWMIFPIVCVASLVFLTARSQYKYTDGQLRNGLNAALGLIILLNILLSSFLFAAFAPVKALGRCI